MPTLTVTEKAFWKERIAARIDRAIERIKAQHPSLFDRVQREARARTLASLGLGEAYAELEAIDIEETRLARRKKQAQRRMVAAVRGVPVEEVPDTVNLRYGSALALPMEAADAIAKRQAVHHEQLLADDPVGGEIARLEREKEGLLDTVWLSTSPGAIRTLWSQVATLLGDEPTPLERAALAIPPVDRDATHA
jgi:hypothetical protein